MRRVMYGYRRWLSPVLVLFILVGMGNCCFAGGIKVSPAAFCLQNAEVGKDLDLGLDLIITNNSDNEETFLVRSLKPSQAVEKWVKGYSEIPDAGWFYFNENEIKIGPNSDGKLRMHLKVPDEEKYYNQHWMVYVEVATQAQEGKMFLMAIKPDYMIETQSKIDVKEKPYGILGLVPGVVKAEKVIPGKAKKVSFRIYNNDQTAHTYEILSYIPEASSAKQDISVTAGYEWINKDLWVMPREAKIKLKPGQAKDITVNILVPKGSECSDVGWESIVLVKPDKGLEGFVRILIEPLE